MKKFYILYALILVLINDISAQFKDGDINYEVVSAVTLTAQVGSNNELSGDIVIPETVSDGTDTYTVVGVKGWAFAQGEGATSSISSIVLPNTVTTISNDAFANCILLNSVTLGEGLTYIGVGAFYKAGLTNITLPNSLTTIDNVAFFANVNLTDITFGSELSTIGSQSFAFCHPLENVSITAETPPAINVNSFEGLVLSDINITVPEASVSTYTNTEIWQDFNYGMVNNSLIELEPEIIIYPNPVMDKLTIKSDANTIINNIAIFNINGQVITNTTSNTINVQDFPKGIYTIKVNTNNGISTNKIIKN